MAHEELVSGGDRPAEMDHDHFVQHLLALSLEEGRDYIQRQAAALADPLACALALKDEALRQRDINPFLSLKLAHLLIFLGEHLQQAQARALGYVAKGDALVVIRHDRAAMEALDVAAEEFLRLGDEVGWARSRLSWMIAAAWLGRSEEALQAATQAHEIFMRHGERYRACTVDHNTAVIYTQLGEYQKALAIYERIQAIYHTLRDLPEASIKHAVALAQYNQARNLAWLGNFDAAYALLLQTQATFAALGMSGQVVDQELSLAELDYAQGYYGEALRRYYRAYDLTAQQHLDELLAWLMMKIATCLVKLDRAEEACELVARAVEVRKERGSLLDTADGLREYALVLATAGRRSEALQALEEAGVLFTQGGLEHHASLVRLQRAELLLEMQSLAEAYREAEALKPIFEARGLVACAARARLVLAAVLICCAEEGTFSQEPPQVEALLKEAVTLCRETVLLARRHNLQEQAYRAQHLLGRVAARQADLQRAGRHYRAAIAQIERILDHLVYDLGPAFLRTTWAVYEDMIALSLQRKQAEQALGYLERARSMALRQYLTRKKGAASDVAGSTAEPDERATLLRLQHELETWQQRYHRYSTLLSDLGPEVPPDVDQEVIRAELRRCEQKVSELFERLHLQRLERTPPQVRRQRRAARPARRLERHVAGSWLQRHLQPTQTLLAYYLHQQHIVIFALTSDRLQTYQVTASAAQVERLLLLLHTHLQPGGWSDIRHPPQQAIRGLLRKLHTLLIEPVAPLLPPADGHLTIVPYGPLHTLPFHALYDGERFLIERFQVSYLPACSMLPVAEVRSRAAGAASPLVFGYSGNGQLLRALDEARTLAALLEARCYLEAEATIERLRQEVPGSPLIHLATHGRSRLDAPNFSYVRLADGQLNAIDAFSLDLSGCALVTLSGCETGLSLSGGGDEQLGLGRAFLAAGAASLVMSLWAVEDSATAELMRFFYLRLLAGDTRSEALRAAQSALLRSSSYSHPYFWASFRLVGEAGALPWLSETSC